MEKDLEKQNKTLQIRIKQLQEQINTYINNYVHKSSINKIPIQTDDSTQTLRKICHSDIDFSPIQTCQSLHDEIISIDIPKKSTKDEVTFTLSNKNLDKFYNSQNPSNFNKFELDDQMNISSNLANSELSKQFENQEIKIKISAECSHDQQVKSKSFYNSTIRQKNHCEDCISKMHQIHEMQFLKNKYHRQYIALRGQLDKVKIQIHQNEYCQTPRSSINLIEIYGEHNNQDKSQKSSFSFENIQNTLLSERFALQVQECIKLIEKLLFIDRKFIELSSADCKLLVELQLNIENLKFHIGLDTEPKYLEDLFNELQKSELSISKIHQKYRKLLDKIVKTHKEKIKRSKEQFNQVNEMCVIILKDLRDTKIKNQKLSSQIEILKSQSYDVKETNSQSLSSSHDLKSSKESTGHEILIIKERDLHDSTLSQLEKSSSYSQIKMEKQIEKYQFKLKNSEKQYKNLQKVIKQLKFQLNSLKKKSLNDFNQFMNAIIFNSNSKMRNTTQQTEICQFQQNIQRNQQFFSQFDKNETDELRTIRESSNKKLVEEIGTLVYQIFSFTSWENDQNQNIFLPQTEEEIIQMLTHIKKFAAKFDEWQKQKEKQINGFQRNFLQILKFFIDNYKVQEDKLLEQICKMKDNEPLVLYIKKYYSKNVLINDPQDRDSSSFTFGQKSQSCKDSEIQP